MKPILDFRRERSVVRLETEHLLSSLCFLLFVFCCLGGRGASDRVGSPRAPEKGLVASRCVGGACVGS